MVDTVQWGYIALSGIGGRWPEFSEPVLQYIQVYSKVGVYRSVHISTSSFVSAKYKCTRILDSVTMGICPEESFSPCEFVHEETRDGKKELDDIDNKFDEQLN